MNLTAPRALLLGLSLLVAGPVEAQIGRLDFKLGAHLYDIAAHRPAPDADTASITLRAASDVRASIIRELVLNKGEAMLGTDYVLGANRDDAVDCSALVQQMFGVAGIDLPRTSRELATVGKPVRRSELAPGDLLFYRWGKRGLHVGVYVADGKILHASTGKREVVLTQLTSTWHRRMVGARRPL